MESKFGTRVISRLTDTPWPARSPDLSCLDYWFWSVCLSELRRCPASTLEEVIRAARDITVRAKVCKQAQGGPFEFMLKKYKRNVNREE